MILSNKDLVRNLEERRTFYNYLQEHKITKDYELVFALDEVGRGPLFGEVISACVVLKKESILFGLKDSKALSEKKRLEMEELIRSEALVVSLGSSSVEEIDKLNILQASLLSMKRALLGTGLFQEGDSDSIRKSLVLVDGNKKIDLECNQLTIVKGDDLMPSISAASIIAKNHRDKIMDHYDLLYPMYDLKNNKGYGTKKHVEGLKAFGPCEFHRKSFLSKILEKV